MKESEAKNLVDTTFTAAYSEDKIRLFIRNLFHDGEERTEKASNGKYIPEAFRDGIVSYKRLFKFVDPEDMEIDVLAVKLKTRRTLENARTMQRNFIARYLNGSRGGVLKDAALVAFYTDDSDEWRFSLVRMDYVLDEVKNKVKKELTPARRFSFLVGGSEKTHTARRQLFPVLNGATKTTLTELEKAFNIESVTKEFFEKYKGLYLRLKQALEDHLKKDIVTKTDFESKSVLTADFSKRLLGQIVFLYFLQKKGWLGVKKGEEWGAGPKDFLQALHRSEYGHYENFFNDMLEPLFYEALTTERTDNFYQRFNCRIPFLNGGLFEPLQGYDWVNTYILLDNTIFTEIFEVFDLYNFTVREDEPLDREVAVDPEMLGKVFENLIPENERRGSGTFYTPREIVHYMCQESLINYLDAKLNIKQHQVEDNNVQPNLLPNMGKVDLLTNYEDVYVEQVPRDDVAEFIYHGDVAKEHDATTRTKDKETRTYSFKIPESIRNNAEFIDEALAVVKICDPAIGSGAFPVGVMNEIVRARQMLNAYLGDEDRTPYDFKRNTIQESIYGVDIEPSAVDIAKLRLWLSLVVDEDNFNNIKPLPNLDYKIMTGDSLIKEMSQKDMAYKGWLDELISLQKSIFGEYSPSRKQEIKDKIDILLENLFQGHDNNFRFNYWIQFHDVMSRGGFDIVMGNPPYVKIQAIEEKIAKKYKQNFISAKGKFDLYILFVELSLDIVKNKTGFSCFIHPHRFLTTSYGKHFKKLLDSSHAMKLAVMFDVDQVFEAVTTYTGIFGYQHGQTSINFAKCKVKDIKITNFSSVNIKQDGSHWTIINSSPENAKILSKIILERNLSTIVDGVFQGVVTTGDDKFILKKVAEISENETRCWSYSLKAEVVIENEILKPCLKGENIKRYREPTSEHLVFYPHYQGRNKTEPLELGYFRRSFPKGYNYIKKYEQELIEKKIQYKTNPKYWYSLHRSRQLKVFEAEKIITPQLQNRPNFTLDPAGYWFPDAGGYMIILKEEYKDYLIPLLGILNSKLLWFFIKNTSNSYQGNYYYFKSDYLKPFGIPRRCQSIEDKISSLVIALIKNADAKSQVSTENLERQIDQLVYQLYSLTPEEIAIIEEDVADKT